MSLQTRSVLAETTAELAAAGCVSAEAEARWLVEEATGRPPHAAGALDDDQLERLRAMVARRAAGEPLQYVIGWAPFGRLRLAVGPGVFVPRPETEGLAALAAAHLREAAARVRQAAGRQGSATANPAAPGDRRPVAVDLCTGSGAIACFLADAVPGARVLATELDERALAWARRNAAPFGVEVLAGDLDEPLPPELAGQVDLLTANVPYVPSATIALLPRDVRDHEPLRALDGGPDGLDVLRRLAARAGRWLRPGGWLVCEIGDDQGEAAGGLLAAGGLADVALHPDLVGRQRVVEGRKP